MNCLCCCQLEAVYSLALKRRLWRPESQADPIQRPFQRSAAADFQHRPIFFAPTVILHRNGFNSKKSGKIEGMAFRTIKNFVRFLIFCPSPRPPSWAPTDWRWLGLRYNLTEILSFDETRTRSRWKRVLVAERVRNSAHWSLFCTNSAPFPHKLDCSRCFGERQLPAPARAPASTCAGLAHGQ